MFACVLACVQVIRKWADGRLSVNSECLSSIRSGSFFQVFITKILKRNSFYHQRHCRLRLLKFVTYIRPRFTRMVLKTAVRL